MLELDFAPRLGFAFFLFVIKVKELAYKKKNLEKLINHCVNS